MDPVYIVDTTSNFLFPTRISLQVVEDNSVELDAREFTRGSQKSSTEIEHHTTAQSTNHHSMETKEHMCSRTAKGEP